MSTDQTRDDQANERRAEDESEDGRAVARREGFGGAIADDVEGHSSRPRGPESQHPRGGESQLPRGPESQHPRATGDDDDVEGHGFSTRGTSTRGD